MLTMRFISQLDKSQQHRISCLLYEMIQLLCNCTISCVSLKVHFQNFILVMLRLQPPCSHYSCELVTLGAAWGGCSWLPGNSVSSPPFPATQCERYRVATRWLLCIIKSIIDTVIPFSWIWCRLLGTCWKRHLFVLDGDVVWKWQHDSNKQWLRWPSSLNLPARRTHWQCPLSTADEGLCILMDRLRPLA